MRAHRIVAVSAVGFLAACSGDSNQESLLEPQMTGTMTGYVDVQKFGPAGTYDFTATATGGNLYSPTFQVDAGTSRTIWSQNDPTAASADVRVTEVLAPGMQVDSIIVVTTLDDGLVESITRITGTNSATVFGVNVRRDARIKIYNSFAPPPPPPPPGGLEGCTPGYWKQTQHFDSWVGYLPTDSFASVFGVSYPGTLLDALKANGGGANALARHSVAALLNASGDVDYAMSTPAQVISAVQAAFASGDFETQKDQFASWNERGCTLN